MAPGVDVQLELQRRDVVRSLRSSFLKKCKKQKGGTGSCAAAFDKWHFAVLRLADEQDDPVSHKTIQACGCADSCTVVCPNS